MKARSVSEAAGERPLVCVIDDEQRLDQASAQALGVVARRLGAEVNEETVVVWLRVGNHSICDL